MRYKCSWSRIQRREHTRAEARSGIFPFVKARESAISYRESPAAPGASPVYKTAGRTTLAVVQSRIEERAWLWPQLRRTSPLHLRRGRAEFYDPTSTGAAKPMTSRCPKGWEPLGRRQRGSPSPLRTDCAPPARPRPCERSASGEMNWKVSGCLRRVRA
ncbi:hypothetical protein NDU88_010853 [Pleurodeles waltl]|uniref:Uncharacterized protein n=1 Tax=Pleurodeles waltl TaxID=8319 RepID=A0AAV7QX35_PLEWA|nr:hypothetical protein NDU88_010853 [Pleurodeles waltl]